MFRDQKATQALYSWSQDTLHWRVGEGCGCRGSWRPMGIHWPFEKPDKHPLEKTKLRSHLFRKGTSVRVNKRNDRPLPFYFPQDSQVHSVEEQGRGTEGERRGGKRWERKRGEEGRERLERVGHASLTEHCLLPKENPPSPLTVLLRRSANPGFTHVLMRTVFSHALFYVFSIMFLCTSEGLLPYECQCLQWTERKKGNRFDSLRSLLTD